MPARRSRPISGVPVPWSTPAFEENPGGDWSAQVKRELARASRNADGSVTCGSCPRTFDCGWAWISHFERSYGRMRCASNNLIAVWGFYRKEPGMWARRLLTVAS